MFWTLTDAKHYRSINKTASDKNLCRQNVFDEVDVAFRKKQVNIKFVLMWHAKFGWHFNSRFFVLLVSKTNNNLSHVKNTN